MLDTNTRSLFNTFLFFQRLPSFFQAPPKPIEVAKMDQKTHRGRKFRDLNPKMSPSSEHYLLLSPKTPFFSYTHCCNVSLFLSSKTSLVSIVLYTCLFYTPLLFPFSICLFQQFIFCCTASFLFIIIFNRKFQNLRLKLDQKTQKRSIPQLTGVDRPKPTSGLTAKGHIVILLSGCSGCFRTFFRIFLS